MTYDTFISHIYSDDIVTKTTRHFIKGRRAYVHILFHCEVQFWDD